MPTAVSADGKRHNFPEGTPKAVIDKVMRDYAAKRATEQMTEPDEPASQQAAPPRNVVQAMPTSPPPTPERPRSKSERVVSNFLADLHDAAMTGGSGVSEIFFGPEPGAKPSKLFGYEQNQVVSGGTNVINALGKLVGAGIGVGMDTLGDPSGAADPYGRLPSEKLGEDIIQPLFSVVQEGTGSKTPGKDFLESIDTDPRYVEGALNVAGAGVTKPVIKAVNKAIVNRAKTIDELIKIRDTGYNHPTVTNPNVTPAEVTRLGQDFDRIQTNTIFSQKLDPDVANVRKIMNDIVATGQNVSLEAVEKMRKAINDYAYAPTTTAQEARALIMMRKKVDELVERVSPEAAAHLRNARGAAQRLDKVKGLGTAVETAKTKPGPLTDTIRQAPEVRDPLIDERAARKEAKRGFPDRSQMTNEELKRTAKLHGGRSISSTLGRIASAPTVTRGVALAAVPAVAGGAYAYGVPGSGPALGAISTLLALGLLSKGVSRANVARQINALDRAYRRFNPEVPPVTPTAPPPAGLLTPPPIRGGPPAPAPVPAPAAPPPQALPAPPAAPPRLALPPPTGPVPAPSGPVATPPGPLPVERGLPAPGDFTPPPRVVTPPAGPMRLPTPEEMAEIRKTMTKEQFQEFLSGVSAQPPRAPVGSGPRAKTGLTPEQSQEIRRKFLQDRGVPKAKERIAVERFEADIARRAKDRALKDLRGQKVPAEVLNDLIARHKADILREIGGRK